MNKTIVYTYDNGGNMLSQKEYSYTTGTVGTATKTVANGYDTAWKDTGDLVGLYIAPTGTPMRMLYLPYDKIGLPAIVLQVQQSIEVIAGQVAPWFDQIGGGIQYKLGTPLDQLISEGIIKILVVDYDKNRFFRTP